jgi:hypothetical protein
VVGGIDPFEDVYGTVLETRTVGETDIEIDRDVGASNPEFLRWIGRTPDIDTVFFALQFSVLLEVRIDSH